MIRKFLPSITLALLAVGARAQTNTGFVRTEDITYGRKVRDLADPPSIEKT